MFKFLKCTCWQITIRNYVKNTIIKEMKYLNVAEKNDAAKTIAGLLSNGASRRREGYSVYNKIYEFETTLLGKQSKMVMTSVSGHLMHLEFLVSYRNWRNVDPRSLFDAPIRKSVGEDFEPIKRTLEREIRGCQGLIIWTDCDREGENIGFEIIDVCRSVKPNIAVYRAIFSEITSVGVRRALQRLTQPDKRQSDAVNVRSELDLRTGAAITRFQTMRFQRLFPEKIADKLISYGSCQIPTLGFVAERYKEIEAFVSEPFWKLKVIHTIEDLTVEFNWARNRLFNKQACEDYLLVCLADPKAKVECVTVKPKHKWRPTPMDTVEMEKLGSRKLKLSAKETMTIAEKLYTKGIISYPRTETNMFSKEIDLRSLVEQQTGHSEWGSFAQRVLEWGPNPRNGSKSDQAHPPIHPTKLVTILDGNEARVYELVVRHFLACVSKDGVGSETVVHINIAGEKFSATGLCIYERNYLDVYIYDKWNAKQIHKYEQGQIFEPTEISMQEGATTAPPLLTEADLIALMEKHGIGTDATHAEHINTIKERGYIGVVDKGALVPGVIGMGLYEGYDAMELALAKPLLRAEFEADLKRICLGEKDPKIVLSEQIRKYKAAYQQIMDKITAMDEKIAQRIQEAPKAATGSSDPQRSESTDLENNPNRLQELYLCPKCAVAPLALKQKRNQNGYLIGCLNFPDCKNTIWWPDDCKEPSVLDECCTKCGETFKMLKFKFTSAFYRTMFNAPFGWYKTCLRCDAQFRNAFNINLDCVKRVGGIVEAAGANEANVVHRAPIASNSREQSNEFGSRGSSGPARKKLTGNTKQDDIAKQKRRITKTNNNSAGTINKRKKNSEYTNIRSYFTAATGSHTSTVNEQVRDVPMDEFFDSNDGFDELMLAAEENVAAATTDAEMDDIAAAFAADDDGDFDDFDLDAVSAGNAPPQPPPSPPRQTVLGQSFDDSFLAFGDSVNDGLDNFAWGTSARARLTTPSAPNNPCLQEPVSVQPRYTRHDNDDHVDRNETITWGSKANQSYIEPEHGVRCNGCHQPAKELTAKRDGPNKGRVFFVCGKSNPCKFFQWADEEATTMSASNSTQGSNTRSVDIIGGWGTGNNAIGGSNVRSATTAVDADMVPCNCGEQASSFIVRKDGPNKGRPFFSCPKRDKSCGFFKWADDQNNQASISSNSWGSGGDGVRPKPNNTPSNNRSIRSDTQPKTRKCGMCRQEGHTRNKCPRKSEFEY